MTVTVTEEMQTIILKKAEDTESFAENFAKNIAAPSIIFLEGELGAGKTTFTKGFLRGLGYTKTVKSPTFTLVETYDINERTILHADLYRIKDPCELEAMGFRDYFNEKNIILIEWASRARSWLPKPTVQCTLVIPENGVGRVLQVI